MSVVSLPASRIISFRIAKLLSKKHANAVLGNPYQMGSGGTGGRTQGIFISKRLPKQIVGIPHNKSIIWGQFLRGARSGDTQGVTWRHYLLETPYQMGSGDTLGTPWGHHVLENPYQMGSGGTGGRAQGILISKRLAKQIVGIPHNKSTIWGQVLRGTGSGDTHGVPWGHHLLENPYQMGSLGTPRGRHILENPYQVGS